MDSSFQKLSPELQKIIFQMGWKELHPLQEESIDYLICSPSQPGENTQRHLILSAPTASGKTEAAFLPFISNVIQSAKEQIKVLYISPLKTLINDQGARIEQLCSSLEIPVMRWHGDVSNYKKVKLIDKPAGIIMITPESIEGLFQRKSDLIPFLFNKLEYIIIDEIHYFMESERGVHLKSLLYRMGLYCHISPSIIALSATIKNPDAVAEWISPNAPEQVKVITDNSFKSGLKGLVITYQPDKTSFEEQFYPIIKQGKNLVFSQNKKTIEFACDLIRKYSKKNHFSDNIYIHHGSLIKKIREDTESELKRKNNITVFCSSTLELGIDIGNIDRIIFLNPPNSVNSFIQRLGRSGRTKGKSREFIFFPYKIPQDELFDPFEKVCALPIVQSIALVELFLQGWQEDLVYNKRDFSTFTFQILAFMGEYRCVRVEDIFRIIVNGSFNNAFSITELFSILRSLYKHGVIYQHSNDSLGLTIKGEKLVEKRDFLCSFSKEIEWTVINNEKIIGMLPVDFVMNLRENDVFLLAGFSWRVLSIQSINCTVIVAKSALSSIVKFYGNGPHIHPEIHKKMKEIYTNKFIPEYISSDTKNVLSIAYQIFDLYAKDEHYMMTFLGSKIQNTLYFLFDSMGILCSNQKVAFRFSMKNAIATLIEKLRIISIDHDYLKEIISNNPEELLYRKKYDEYLPRELLTQAFINEQLDFPGTIEFCKKLLQ